VHRKTTAVLATTTDLKLASPNVSGLPIIDCRCATLRELSTRFDLQRRD